MWEEEAVDIGRVTNTYEIINTVYLKPLRMSTCWTIYIVLLCYCSVYMSNKIDTLNIYTLLHEEVLQVVSTIQWIQLMIYNGLHEAYIHTMRKCHL